MEHNLPNQSTITISFLHLILITTTFRTSKNHIRRASTEQPVNTTIKFIEKKNIYTYIRIALIAKHVCIISKNYQRPLCQRRVHIFIIDLLGVHKKCSVVSCL